MVERYGEPENLPCVCVAVHSLWSRLESWYGEHCPAIAATFNPAATAAQWDDYLQVTTWKYHHIPP